MMRLVPDEVSGTLANFAQTERRGAPGSQALHFLVGSSAATAVIAVAISRFSTCASGQFVSAMKFQSGFQFADIARRVRRGKALYGQLRARTTFRDENCNCGADAERKRARDALALNRLPMLCRWNLPYLRTVLSTSTGEAYGGILA